MDGSARPPNALGNDDGETMKTSYRFRPFLKPTVLALSALSLPACEGAIPTVAGQEIILPSRSPTKRVQAMEAPSVDDAGAEGDAHAESFCQGGGVLTREAYNPDGSFVTEYTCEAGGGIQSFRHEGTIDPLTGDGAYDQVTVYEDGTDSRYHFVLDTLDDGSQVYEGTSEDGSTTSHIVYVPLEDGSDQANETWSTPDGDYLIEGIYFTDGSWHRTTIFDDPATAANPDYVVDEIRSADGSSIQDVSTLGDGYTSDYTYRVNVDGSSRYDFSTDLTETLVNPDFDGTYQYAADLSGSGSYVQHFDDGSSMLVTDEIRSDGSLRESWSFDDISTEAPIDQEGTIDFAVDGSGEGTVTTHVVGGEAQTCQVHISADGVSIVDACE
jgi:hypothetical protein